MGVGHETIEIGGSLRIKVRSIYERAKCKDGNLDDLLKELVPVIKTLEKKRPNIILSNLLVCMETMNR